jgi:hypothetical protein
MRVRVLDPERTLVTASDDGTWVWGFYLFPEDGGRRLLSGNGIKERAENLAQEPVTAGPPAAL